MKYINKTNNELITRAIAIAENLLKADSRMMKEIYIKNNWKYGNGTGKEICLKIYKPIKKN